MRVCAPPHTLPSHPGTAGPPTPRVHAGTTPVCLDLALMSAPWASASGNICRVLGTAAAPPPPVWVLAMVAALHCSKA